DQSDAVCLCDLDCGEQDVPCGIDDHCDRYCDPNGSCVDEDCLEVGAGICALNCESDGECNQRCVSYPDCETSFCNQVGGVCESGSVGSSASCPNDPDCGPALACEADDYCDPNCLAQDPDCECQCDFYFGICEATIAGDEECGCDLYCQAEGVNSCLDDGHCDTYCDGEGSYRCTDPNCNVSASTGECVRP
ncbi:MAG: hypothetical protein KC561_07660, partial [Myxococcales bacterium]|nr:hypothetical protein [Myxococcales bacterium]